MAGQPHIAIFVYPVPGRFIPAMILASRLVDSGAKVSFICPSHRLSLLEEAKSRGLRKGIEIVELKLEADEVDAIPEDLFKTYKLMNSILARFREFAEDLPHPLSCIISDEVSGDFFEAAKRFKVKRYLLIPESAFAFSATMYVKKLAEDSLIPLPSGPDAVVDIPLLNLPLGTDEFLSPYQTNSLDSWVRQKFTQGAIASHGSDGVLINTFQQLEPSILSGLRNGREVNPNAVQVVPVGPLIPNDIPGTSAEHTLCMEFLNRYPKNSVVFASFGSLRKCSEQQIKSVFDGLKASGFPFIWMLRCETDYRPEVPKNGLILVTWAPQLQILSHASTGIFMTHCGWNSTLESVCCGVPLLVTMAEFMDQKMNSKLAVEVFKVGLKLESVDKDCIAESIKRLMGLQQIRENSARLKAAAEEAAGFAGQNLKDFVESLPSY